MEETEKKDFQKFISDAGQVERILTSLEFSKALVSAYDMETLLTTVLERIKILRDLRKGEIAAKELDPEGNRIELWEPPKK